jgi:opacity protein-like surface antigen
MLALIGIGITSASALAQSAVGPDAAWFGGIGGAYSRVDVDQSTLGVSDPTSVYQDGTLVATGTAGGPAVPYGLSDDSAAPLAQVGYFERFAASNMLWGFKLTYQYDGADMERREILPQSGAFTPVGGSPDSFTGNVLIGSSKTRVSHQLALFPFLGQSFTGGFFYAGGGPVLVEVDTEIRNAIGFADINGRHSDITGAPLSFSSSEWVWGGGVQVGLAYFLNDLWFVDVNYTWMRTGTSSKTFTAQFSSSYEDSGATITTEGGANLVVDDELTTQSLAISINRAF